VSVLSFHFHTYSVVRVYQSDLIRRSSSSFCVSSTLTSSLTQQPTSKSPLNANSSETYLILSALVDVPSIHLKSFEPSLVTQVQLRVWIADPLRSVDLNTIQLRTANHASKKYPPLHSRSSGLATSPTLRMPAQDDHTRPASSPPLIQPRMEPSLRRTDPQRRHTPVLLKDQVPPFKHNPCTPNPQHPNPST